MNDAWMRFSASYSGSFNPLHFDHVDAIREIFSFGYDRVHVFVRDDPRSDIVPWTVKEEWFRKLNEEFEGKLLIYRMPSAVAGKNYDTRMFINMILDEDRLAGEKIRGFYFGCDHEKLVKELVPFFPDRKFHIGNRGRGYSSSEIRADIEGHKDWMPEYVYVTIQRQNRKE